MVDGSMDLSMSSETNRSDGGNLRRFSMGKASLLSIDEQCSSGERRSSTGSCHDFCKYGHKHSLEKKARVPLLKRAMKKSLDGQNSDQVVAVLEKDKQSVRVTKSKVSPSLGICITGGTDVVRRIVPINSPSTSRRSPLETEVMSESKVPVGLVNSPSRRSPVEIEVTSERKELVVPENSPRRQSPVETEVTSGSKKRAVPMNSPGRQSSVEIEVTSERKGLVVPENSPRRESPVETEITSGSKKRVVPVNYPGSQSSVEIEVTSERKELVVPENSTRRQRLVETEVTSGSKKRVVPVNSPGTQSSVEIEVTSERKELVVPENSPRKLSPVEFEVMSKSKELVLPVNSRSKQSPVEIEVTSKSKERVVPANSPSRRGLVEIGVTIESKELVVPESSPSRQSPYRRSPLKSEVMNESKELVAKTKTIPKTQKPRIDKTTKQVVYSSTKSESSPKRSLTNIGEAGGNSLLKPKALKVKSVSSSRSTGNIAVHRNSGSKSGGGAGTLKGNGTQVVGNSIVTSDPNSVDVVVNLPAIKNKNLKVVSRVISQNKTRRARAKEAPSVESQEKTLYVINMETKKTKLVESDQNEKHGLKGYPKSPSSLANGPSLSPHKEDRGGTKYTKSEANATLSGPKKHNGIQKEDDHNGIKKGRSPRMRQTKGKDSSSLNLSFRNRKVVDLHSESHGPTRLKFMRGQSIGDNQKSKDSYKTSLKKGIVKGISKNSTPPSEKVVLKHQDVQGKKDTQVLFNNVIAETARKLVRTRKSKVKALVGAFEKVISLQDKKPYVRATA